MSASHIQRLRPALNAVSSSSYLHTCRPVKVHAGCCRMAGLGYEMGGGIGYGLQRLAVNDKPQQKPPSVLFAQKDSVRRRCLDQRYLAPR